MPRHLPTPCQDLLELQHGVIARWQLAEVEALAARLADTRLQVGRWQPLYRGVYATFTGQPSRMAVLWAAVLRGGPGSALSHDTAAELDGLADKPSSPIHVTVLSPRQPTISRQEWRLFPKIVIYRCARLNETRHPARMPPRTRIEETTVDLVQASPTLDQALSWPITACGRRLTTAEILLAAMAKRGKLRWRTEVADALNDASEGVHSLLEWRYVRGVERAHGLPQAARQAKSRAAQRTRYLDNRYREFGVAVELDGRAAHPVEARWHDIHRDNASAGVGIVTLRYGWADVTDDPCRVAAEVAQVLKLRGWTGRPHACRPGCPAALA